MRWNPLETKAVMQNLKDAGCTQGAVAHFLALWEGADRKSQIRFLRRHRSFLLDGIHIAQKKLDCLDYLIYQLEKEARRLSHDEVPLLQSHPFDL